MQCQTIVEASPSALCDSTHQLASGLPSMIQDGSIGRGVKFTVSLAISINARDIQNSQQPEGLAGRGLQGSERRLNFPYEVRRNRRPAAIPYANSAANLRTHAHSPFLNTGTRRPSA